MPSIFTKILRGETRASFVHRDAIIAAFLDIAPLSDGHCLVVPVRETARLADLPPPTLAALTAVARKVGDALQAADPTITGLNWLLCDGEDAGQEVFHIHLHVIPRRHNDGLRFGGKSRKASRADLDIWADRIAGELS